MTLKDQMLLKVELSNRSCMHMSTDLSIVMLCACATTSVGNLYVVTQPIHYYNL